MEPPHNWSHLLFSAPPHVKNAMQPATRSHISRRRYSVYQPVTQSRSSPMYAYTSGHHGMHLTTRSSVSIAIHNFWPMRKGRRKRRGGKRCRFERASSRPYFLGYLLRPEGRDRPMRRCKEGSHNRSGNPLAVRLAHLP